jgi:hypothetical protein
MVKGLRGGDKVRSKAKLNLEMSLMERACGWGEGLGGGWRGAAGRLGNLRDFARQLCSSPGSFAGPRVRYRGRRGETELEP